jgi:uncharacterized protein (TIGR03083 family)
MCVTDAVVLLAGAISYALGAAVSGEVAPGDLGRPTPCADWDLGTLLRHLAESMATLSEALATGNVSINPARGLASGSVRVSGPASGVSGPASGVSGEPSGVSGEPVELLGNRAGEPVELLRDRAAELLCAAFAVDEPPIRVEGVPVPRGMIVAAGAVEIAVHGWDVSAACGGSAPVPAELAGPLVRELPQLIDVRDGLFGPPVAVPALACPGARLVAYLGRDPGRHQWLLASSIGVSST